MQNHSYNNTSTSYGSLNNFTVSSPFLDQSDGYDYSSLYSSNFPPNPSPFPLSPSSAYSTAADVPVVMDYNQFLDLAPFQDLINLRNWCLTQLQTAANDAEALRQENINLQMTNIELTRRLNLMPQASFVNNYFPPPSPSDDAAVPLPSIADSFRRLKIAEKVARERLAWYEGSNAASEVVDNPVEKINYFPPPPPCDYAAVPLPSIAGSFRRLKIVEKEARERRAWNEGSNAASEVENIPVEKIGGDRVKLPKSISIRSNDYLKTAQGSGITGGRVRVPNRSKSAAEAQRVYVRGGKEEEEPLELHVFNQGMSKTELCNKWQETGACPYGEHCQFAHGIGELRPVLRHPRYKTEVCRMVLAGDHCPYGHRCHFRHSLTEEERLVGQRMNPRRSLKM